MKACGPIVHIDDIGRIAIPREFRRQLKVKEGDAFELYTEGDAFVLKKHDDKSELLHLVELIASRTVDDSLYDGCDSADVACVKALAKMLKKVLAKKEVQE